MTRLSDRHVLQMVDNSTVVLVDESSGEEIVLGRKALAALAQASQYFLFQMMAPRLACPGPHKVVQFRDGKPPHCKVCGKTATGEIPVSHLDRNSTLKENS